MPGARFITSSAKHLTPRIGNTDPNAPIFVYPRIFVSKLAAIHHADTSRVYRVSFWLREQVLNLNTAAEQDQDDDLYLAVTETGHKVGVRGSVSYLPSQLINPSPNPPPTTQHPPTAPPFARRPVTVQTAEYRVRHSCCPASISRMFWLCGIRLRM